MSAIIKLPPVKKIQGFSLVQHDDPKKCSVELQYTEPSGKWCEITMSLHDALYLLNMLEAMSRDNGYDSIRRDISLN